MAPTRAVAADVILLSVLALQVTTVSPGLAGRFLTPPYFNLAQGRRITSTSTCGVNVPGPELYCQLTGATGVIDAVEKRSVISGQLCDFCNPSAENQAHPPEFAIDGTERWWQSPPLSRGSEYNRVNVTIDLGQEFLVAYIFIKMANSPRPGVWILERSTDYGQTWKPWQYFADTPSDCLKYFNVQASRNPVRDDSVICTTQFSKVVPLEKGEIAVSLVIGRPNAENFSHSEMLQDWTKATTIRLQLLQTKTLLGHLMALRRQDPTVTRRYFYSIKDISIGGRCVCNGHAQSCDKADPTNPNKLLCNCEHNTCGPQCERCCDGYVQKRWRRVTVDRSFECERCQCFGHAERCIYDEEVDRRRLSLDIHGRYDGGGVCQGCRHETEGVNCQQCKFGFYRPFNVALNDTRVCQPCNCDPRLSTGGCEEGTGRCHCKQQFTGENCDRCSSGFYSYPVCQPCECNFNGTDNAICHVGGGQCPCKPNYVGQRCDMCGFGYYNFPECIPCHCNQRGSSTASCDVETGQCTCRRGYTGRECGECFNGYFGFPGCKLCSCDVEGCVPEICDALTGRCLCKKNYIGAMCDTCAPGYFYYPHCRECRCARPGSFNSECQDNGQCSCKINYGGLSCEHCTPGYYKYPECNPCHCNPYGSLGNSCDQRTGQCNCRSNFEGQMCDRCRANFYNYPRCVECNCNPAGAMVIPGYPLGGCGAATSGQLCECKERVMGNICDTCKPGFWDLDINNPKGCTVCECNAEGTIAGINICNVEAGQCYCKTDVSGRNCDHCKDGTYDLTASNPFGCRDCECNLGGSVTSRCDKRTGSCVCKPQVAGQKCNRPLQTYYFPTLHQHKYELEDGYTPSQAKTRYRFNPREFPEFSWKGYAVLSAAQPEVRINVDIRKPALYRLLLRYTNPSSSTVQGDVTLTPRTTDDTEQMAMIAFLPTSYPQFTKLSSSTFVLNPGTWTIAIKAQNVLLDYLVLIPQPYYEATVLEEQAVRPCFIPGDNGLCLHYGYPDVKAYITAKASGGYKAEGGQRVRVSLFQNSTILSELQIPRMVQLDNNQNSFYLDLGISQPDMYVIVVSYFNSVKGRTQGITVEGVTPSGRVSGTMNLYECQYSTLCRQVVTGTDGKPSQFNFTSGLTTLKITGDANINAAIESVTAIPYSSWTLGYVKPSIICIKVNGVCIRSRYSVPSGALRIDVESGGNEDKRDHNIPSHIIDQSVGLVRLNRSLPTISVEATVHTPGQYVLLAHYYQVDSPEFNVNVNVRADNQLYSGTLLPTYCSSVSGCRAVVTFGNQGSIINLRDTNVEITFNNTDGDNIWLDYIMLIPAAQFDKSNDLNILPIDQSINFLKDCLTEEFNIRPDAPEHCRHDVFTLTTNYNHGALPCKCNIDGSLRFSCEPFGGQCSCRPNVIGRDCSACRSGYYGFPRCKSCQCRVGLCHPVTGDCVCPPRVTGRKCDMCLPRTYGYDPLVGCLDCDCNPRGVRAADLNCDQITGQCSCLQNVHGKHCESCVAGFYSHPRCLECKCNHQGSTRDICNQGNGVCLCKENTEVPTCSSCRQGTYYLEQENPNGCTTCFCFGLTSSCDRSNLRWHQISGMRGWRLKNTNGVSIDYIGPYISASVRGQVINPTKSVYWQAPSIYLDNRITSYGGQLRYTVLATLPEGEIPELMNRPDVILMGNNMSLIYRSSEQVIPGVPQTKTVNLREYNFVHEKSGSNVQRDQMMMLLVNLEAIYIRGSYFTTVKDIRLSNVQLDTATATGAGGGAFTVEQCHCPTNYLGTSCEKCASGYYRSQTSPYLGVCSPCHCNGHANDCDPVTGECLNCRDNTTGLHCEQCLVGYYGDPAVGGCSICSCPLSVPLNNFAVSCSVTDRGVVSHCTCQPGYRGVRCDICDSGYYGQPTQLGQSCQPCGCSGNINRRRPGSCDGITGECLICGNNSTGSNCETCKDWWYGDAVISKSCRPCTCNRCGSVQCNPANGVCLCKPDVIGPDCDRCPPDYFGFENCDGCKFCDCAIASANRQCNQQTGQCPCLTGTTGRRCETCMQGYWNYGRNGCQRCSCLSDGAVTCDVMTGQCQCLPGVTGANCDECLPRWILVPGKGCQVTQSDAGENECNSCVHLLLDDLDHLHLTLSNVLINVTAVSVGREAHLKLAEFNETVYRLRPTVDVLLTNGSNITFSPIYEQIKELNKTADILKLKSENKMKDAKSSLDDAKHLKNEIDELDNHANKTISDAKHVVDHAHLILQRIHSNIQKGNISTYLPKAREILEELSKVDFSSQNNSCHSELETAIITLMQVKNMKDRALIQRNHSDDIRIAIRDVLSRLYDLQDKTRSSQTVTRKTINLINRLKDLSNIKQILHNIDTSLEDTDSLQEMATKLMNLSYGTLDDIRMAFLKLERETSRLEAGYKTVEEQINKLKNELSDLRSLVNNSIFHAEEQEQLANSLEKIYVSTNLTEEIFAYQKIVSAINEALNAAREALNTSTHALRKTSGVGESSLKSKQLSIGLLNLARQAYNTTKTELTDWLRAAIAGIRQVSRDNKYTARGLNRLKQILENFQVGKLGIRANIAAENAMMANRRASVVQQWVQNIFVQLPEDKAKLKQLPLDISSTNRLMTETRKQVDLIRGLLPNMSTLFATLSSTRSKINASMQATRINIRKLSQKIVLARDEANSIRVALNFLGNTTVALRTPSDIQNYGSYTKASMFIKTTSTDGLLMYVGNKKEGGSLNQDFMSLQLQNGQVVFKFNLGSGPAVIVNPVNVSDGLWHKINIERVGTLGSLSVQKADKEKVHTPVKTSNHSLGTNTVLELQRDNAIFLAGGVPPGINIPSIVNRGYYTGVMEGLTFNTNPIGLWNFEWGLNNRFGITNRNVLIEVVSPGYKFNGNGYVELSRGSHSFNRETIILFEMMTFSTSGLLIFMFDDKKSGDFLSVELHDGKILFQFDVGGGRVKIMTTGRYDDGKTHSVSVHRSGRNGTLIVDTKKFNKIAPGTLNKLSINRIFVGGYYQFLIPITDVISSGFQGCISNVQFSNTNIDLHNNIVATGVIPGCPIQNIDLSFQDGNYFVESQFGAIGVVFHFTMKMKTKHKDGLLFYAAGIGQGIGFSVSIKDGKIVVVSDPGGQQTRLESIQHNYNDDVWHYIAVRKDGLLLTLNIDDRDIVQKKADGLKNNVATDSPIFFGGVAPSLTIEVGMTPTSSYFRGCIGDVTINGKFMNFALISPQSRIGVSLAGCPRNISRFIPKPSWPTVSMRPTPATGTLPPGVCALPLDPVVSADQDNDAFRFGSNQNSHWRFKSLPHSISKRSEFSLDIKTEMPNGVIFYASDSDHNDFISVYMKDGKIGYAFNCGSGPGRATSRERYNDGAWHTVMFLRSVKVGKLMVDGNLVGTPMSTGPTSTLNVKRPYYFGGMMERVMKLARKNLEDVQQGFVGCLRELKFNKKKIMQHNKTHFVEPCSTNAEFGTFFGKEGGYVKLFDKFSVGLDLEIKIEIKPRKLSGIILAVHSPGGDFLILQMVNGKLFITTDNGGGHITAVYEPFINNELCNGQWHTVVAHKAKNVVRLIVDEIISAPATGKKGSSACNTEDPLYVGGLPDDGKVRAGVKTKENFVGCLRKLQMRKQIHYLVSGTQSGSVQFGSCPTT